jgi:hypothetical protein
VTDFKSTDELMNHLYAYKIGLAKGRLWKITEGVENRQLSISAFLFCYFGHIIAHLSFGKCLERLPQSSESGDRNWASLDIRDLLRL